MTNLQKFEMHNKRCENGCKHYDAHSCNIVEDRLTNIEMNLIDVVGCASHIDITGLTEFTYEEVRALESLIGYGFAHQDHTGNYLVLADNAYHKVKSIALLQGSDHHD